VLTRSPPVCTDEVIRAMHDELTNAACAVFVNSGLCNM